MHELSSKAITMDKQLLLGILMGTSSPIIILNQELAIISISSKAKMLFEVDEKEVIGKNLNELIEPSFRPSLNAILNGVLSLGQQEENFKFIGAGLNLKKEEIPIELSINNIKSNGSAYLIIIINKLDSKKIDVAIQEDFSLFTTLAQTIEDAIFVLDKGYNIIYATPSVQTLLGHAPDFLHFKDFQKLVHPDEVSLLIGLENGEERKLKIKKNNDDYLNVFASLKIVESDEGYHYKLLSLSLKNHSTSFSEKPLQRLKEKLNEFATFLPDQFFLISKEGKIIEVGAAKLEGINIPFNEIAGKDIFEIFPEPASQIIFETIQESLQNNQIQACKFKVEYPGESKLCFEARIIIVEEDTVMAVVRNITEQVKEQQVLLEANLEAERTSKIKDDFMSVMSHEIRTPLNAIIGMTQLLIRRNPSKEQIELLNTIKFSGENLLKIINDILDLSKIRAEKLEFEEIDFNLRKLVKNTRLTHRDLAAEKGLKFKLFIDDDVPEWIKGDYTKLNQILNNLISNAIKFTEQGSVSLDIYLHAQTDNKVTLLFEVSDTGIGIPEDKLSHIFDPFHQASSSTFRKFGGTGLGLSIIKSMVELQQGKIEVLSEEGKGSTFKVYINFNKAPEIIYDSNYASQPLTLEYQNIKDFKVLYVEDVESNQLLVDCLCKEWGVELVLAQNGIEAIEKVQSEEPDLILMDIQMPEMDGFQATKGIRALEGEYYKNIPIIALTAEVSEQSKVTIKSVGMNDFLLKPIDTDDLYQKINYYSNLSYKQKLEDQKKAIISPEASYKYVNFSKTEELYKTDTLGYIRLLNLLVREFEGYHLQVLKSIKEKDFKALSFVKHKVASTIQSFNLKELATLLVKLQHILSNEKNAYSEKEILEECEFYFNSIIDEFHQKIKESTAMTGGALKNN